MRKLPRRLPSNSPSLAWVAFAVLLLALGGGLAGLYTHRQNQESAKVRLIDELTREVAVLNQRRLAGQREIETRKQAVQLKLALQNHKLPLTPIPPDRRVLLPSLGTSPPAPEAVPGAVPATPAMPSVMATVSHP